MPMAIKFHILNSLWQICVYVHVYIQIGSNTLQPTQSTHAVIERERENREHQNATERKIENIHASGEREGKREGTNTAIDGDRNRAATSKINNGNINVERHQPMLKDRVRLRKRDRTTKKNSAQQQKKKNIK